MLTRRSLLVGASALTVALYMPQAASAPPLDREALKFVAQRVRDGLSWWDEGSRKELLKHSFGVTGVKLDIEQITHGDVVAVTDRLLRTSFRALQMAAKQECEGFEFPILEDGKLTVYGQHVVTGLPLAPSDWWPTELFRALDRLAPHYLA